MGNPLALRILGVGLATASLLTSTALADGGAMPEQCSATTFDVAKNTVTLVTIQVSPETAKPVPFILPTFLPPATRTIMCVRSDIIPAPNDYKILLANLVLTIAIDTSSDKRAGMLRIRDGRIAFDMAQGSLSDDEKRRLRDRLIEWEDKADAPNKPGSN